MLFLTVIWGWGAGALIDILKSLSSINGMKRMIVFVVDSL